MIKRHRVTGLLYFCKTATYDPYVYHGSGKYWKRHLRIHGKFVDTIWTQLFQDREDIIEFATFFSELHNIIDAKNINGDKIWANLEIENGIEGMPPGTNRGDIFRKKCREINAGEKNPSYGSRWWNNGIIETRVKDRPDGEGWTSGRLGIANKINSTKNKNGTVTVGENNGRYDHRIHKFFNQKTGETVLSTQYDFIKSHNLNRRGVNRIVDGTRTKHKNWIVLR